MARFLDITDTRLEALQPAAASQERPYLLLEDLLDDPIEWTLCDVTQAGTRTQDAAAPVAIH